MRSRSRLQLKNTLFFHDQAWFRMRLQVRVSESLDYVSLIFLPPSHLAHLISRVCVGLFSCSAAGVSAFASVLGARSTCRALLASVVPCMSLDDSPMHDARNSRGAVVCCLCANPPATTWRWVGRVPRGGGVPKVGFPVRPKICGLSQRWRQG